MSLRILLFFTATCLMGKLTAQTKPLTLKGKVADAASARLLEQASVRLVKQPGSIVLRQALTTRSGFQLRYVPPGHYQLVVSYIGYKNDTSKIDLPAGDTLRDAGTIALQKTNSELLEVVIKTVIPPVIVKSDTLVYNANNYKTRPNASVEDLIRRMPGIEVDKDGNITMQGQKVDKIIIDGQEFFLRDPKSVTRNLTADMIAQVEAFDSQSERARFLGIKDAGGNKTLNLKLKKDKKNLLTGRLFAGYGTQDRYTAGARINKMGSGQWIDGGFLTNNANDAVTARGDSKNGLGSGMQIHTAYDLTCSNQLNRRFSILFDGDGGYTHSEQVRNSLRQTFLTDSTLYENRTHTDDTRARTNRIDMTLRYQLDSLNSFSYRPSVQLNQTLTTGTDTVAIRTDQYSSSNGFTQNQQTTTANSTGHALQFYHHFRKTGRNLVVGLLQNSNTATITGSVKSRLSLFAPSGQLQSATFLDQQFRQTTSASSYGADISYTEPVARGRVLDVQYHLDHDRNLSNKNSMVFNPVTGLYDKTDTLTTNDFTNINTEQRLGLGYNVTGRKISYQLGVAAQVSALQSENHTKGTAIEQNLLNWFPRASMDLRLKKGESIKIGYQGQSVSPTLEQLQPVPDISNPFLIKTGNPALKQQFNHVVSFHYNHINSKKFGSFLASVTLQQAANKIVPATILLPGGVQNLQYVNVNGVYSVGSSLVYGFPLGDRKHGNGKINTNLAYGHDISFLGGEENTRKSLSVGQGVSLNYNYGDQLFVEFSANAGYSHNVYSIQRGLNTDLFTQAYFTDIAYELPFGARLSTNYSLRVTGPQGSLPGNTMMIWNAAVSKNLFRNKSGEIRLSAFDLLNSNTGFTQTMTANYIETATTNVLRRLFLLSFIYRFKTAGR